jgi:hypothetical protein
LQSEISEDSYLCHTGEHGDKFLPMRRLSLAMVERTIKDLVAGNKRQRTDAKLWLSDEDRGQVSFSDCCHFLSMEPEYLRAAIKEFATRAAKVKRRPHEPVFSYRRRSKDLSDSVSYSPARLARYSVRVAYSKT